MDFAEIDCLFKQLKRLDMVCGGALKLGRAQEKDLNWNAADSAERAGCLADPPPARGQPSYLLAYPR